MLLALPSGFMFQTVLETALSNCQLFVDPHVMQGAQGGYYIQIIYGSAKPDRATCSDNAVPQQDLKQVIATKCNDANN